MNKVEKNNKKIKPLVQIYLKLVDEITDWLFNNKTTWTFILLIFWWIIWMLIIWRVDLNYVSLFFNTWWVLNLTISTIYIAVGSVMLSLLITVRYNFLHI